LHQAERQRAVNIIKVRVIEDVVDLSAQLECALFSDPKVLEDRDVIVKDGRDPDWISGHASNLA
jgi:hypothetical protein